MIESLKFIIQKKNKKTIIICGMQNQYNIKYFYKYFIIKIVQP